MPGPQPLCSFHKPEIYTCLGGGELETVYRHNDFLIRRMRLTNSKIGGYSYRLI